MLNILAQLVSSGLWTLCSSGLLHWSEVSQAGMLSPFSLLNWCFYKHPMVLSLYSNGNFYWLTLFSWENRGCNSAAWCFLSCGTGLGLWQLLVSFRQNFFTLPHLWENKLSSIVCMTVIPMPWRAFPDTLLQRCSSLKMNCEVAATLVAKEEKTGTLTIV